MFFIFILYLNIFSQEGLVLPRYYNPEPVSDQIHDQSSYERTVVDNEFNKYKRTNKTYEELKDRAVANPETFFKDYIKNRLSKEEDDFADAVMQIVFEKNLLDFNIMGLAENLKSEIFDIFYKINKYLSTYSPNIFNSYELGPLTCAKKFCADLNERFISENTDYSRMKKMAVKLIGLTSYFANKNEDLKKSFIKSLDDKSNNLNSMFLLESLVALSKINGEDVGVILENKILSLTLPYIKPSVNLNSVIKLGPSDTELDKLQTYILSLLFSRGDFAILKALETDTYYQSILLANSTNFIKGIFNKEQNLVASRFQTATDYIKTFADFALFTTNAGLSSYILEGRITGDLIEPIKISSHNFLLKSINNIEIPQALLAPSLSSPITASISANTLNITTNILGTVSYGASLINNSHFSKDLELKETYAIMLNSYLTASLSTSKIFSGVNVKDYNSTIPLKNFTPKFYNLANYKNGTGSLQVLIEGQLFDPKTVSRIYIDFKVLNYVATIEKAYILSDAMPFDNFLASIKPNTETLNLDAMLLSGTAEIVDTSSLNKLLDTYGLNVARQIQISNALKNNTNLDFTEFSGPGAYTKALVNNGTLKLSNGISVDGSFIELLNTLAKIESGFVRTASISISELGKTSTLDLSVSEFSVFQDLLSRLKAYCTF